MTCTCALITRLSPTVKPSMTCKDRQQQGRMCAFHILSQAGQQQHRPASLHGLAHSSRWPGCTVGQFVRPHGQQQRQQHTTPVAAPATTNNGHASAYQYTSAARTKASPQPPRTFDSSMNFFHPQSCSFLQKRCSVSLYLDFRGSWFTTAMVNCRETAAKGQAAADQRHTQVQLCKRAPKTPAAWFS